MNNDLLHQKVEQMRSLLLVTVNEKGTLHDESVLELSQKLDKLLVQAQLHKKVISLSKGESARSTA